MIFSNKVMQGEFYYMDHKFSDVFIEINYNFNNDILCNTFFINETLAKGEENLKDLEGKVPFSGSEYYSNGYNWTDEEFVSQIKNYKKIPGRFGRSYIVESLEVAEKLALIYIFNLN